MITTTNRKNNTVLIQYCPSFNYFSGPEDGAISHHPTNRQDSEGADEDGFVYLQHQDSNDEYGGSNSINDEQHFQDISSEQPTLILQSSSPPPPASHQQSPTKSIQDSERGHYLQNRHRSQSHQEEDRDWDGEGVTHNNHDSYEADDQDQIKQQQQLNKEKSCLERFSNYYLNNNNNSNNRKMNDSQNTTDSIRVRRPSCDNEQPELNRTNSADVDAQFENFDNKAVIIQRDDERDERKPNIVDTDNNRRSLSNIRPLKRRYTPEMRRSYEVTNNRASGTKIGASNNSPGNNVHQQKYIRLSPSNGDHRSVGSSSDAFRHHIRKDRHTEVIIPEPANDIDYSNDTDHFNSPHSTTTSSVPQPPHSSSGGERLQQHISANKMVDGDTHLQTERKVFDPNAKVGRGDTAEKVWLYEENIKKVSDVLVFYHIYLSFRMLSIWIDAIKDICDPLPICSIR